MSDADMPVIDAEVVEEESTAAVAVVQPHALGVLEKAQQDAMVAFALEHPRPPAAKICKEILDYATLNIEAAASCYYVLERRTKEGKKVKIDGPSIRLAELASQCFMHIRSGSFIVDNDGRKITARGWAYDAQRNVYMQTETSRRITTKTGKTFSEDMQIVTGNACCAIARRNAIFGVVPRMLVDAVYEQCKAVAVGTSETLEARRADVLAKFAKIGVSKLQILRLLERDTEEAIDLEALEFLIGIGTAIREKITTVAQAFAPAEPGEGEAKRQSLREMAEQAREKREKAAQK